MYQSITRWSLDSPSERLSCLESRAEPIRPPWSNLAQASFAELVLPHCGAAYKLARRLVRDATAAEDVVQTAMLRALENWASFRGENARGWLRRIVRNTAFTWLAARRRDPLPVEEEIERQYEATADPALDPEATLARCQDRRRLAALLTKLPPKLRDVLLLRECEEMTYQEIANAIGVPIGTVMSRLARARRLLAKQAEQFGR